MREIHNADPSCKAFAYIFHQTKDIVNKNCYFTTDKISLYSL